MILLTTAIISSVFDIYIFFTFYNSVFVKQYRSNRWFILAVLIYVMALDYAKALKILPFFIILFSLIAFFLMSKFFIANWKQRLFYTIVLISLELAAEILTGLIFEFLLKRNVNALFQDSSSIEYLIGMIFARLLLLLFVRITFRIHVVHVDSMSVYYWLVVMLVPLISIIILYGLEIISSELTISNYFASFLIASGIISINILSFIAYDKISKQAYKLVEHERTKSSMESQISHYAFIVSQSQDTAAYVHDIKHHLKTIHDFLVLQHPESALQYLANLRVTSEPIFADVIVPNNNSIDIILRRMIADADKKNIKIIHDISVQPELPIDVMKLCVILGNALDNAIEACSKLPTDAERVIRIIIKNEEKRLIIRVENTSYPTEIINGECFTTKEDKSRHGFGLQNIKKIVSQNNGNTVIQYMDGYFIINIVFLL